MRPSTGALERFAPATRTRLRIVIEPHASPSFVGGAAGAGGSIPVCGRNRLDAWLPTLRSRCRYPLVTAD
jgi:hypothetical protein